MTQYWRLRLKHPFGDFASEAWDLGEVGIWYGAWREADYRGAREASEDAKEIARRLSSAPGQAELKWDVPRSYANTARRFIDSIKPDHWVVLHLAERQMIGLAQLEAETFSREDHPLNKGDEIYKYRKVSRKKEFPIAALPDAYRLLSAQGRSNVHAFASMRRHVELLAEHATAEEIISYLSERTFDEQLDIMGASAWESFCVAWLIMERNFIPTGLSIGKTLKTFDIVGRNRQTGQRILAQCKKDSNTVKVEEDFIAALVPEDDAYYFAYGNSEQGTHSKPPIRIFGRDDATKWAETENGRVFKRLFIESNPLST
jgi:hypothetical protein